MCAYVDNLANQANTASTSYLSFLQKYAPTSNDFYAFVEGKTDIAYYGHCFNNIPKKIEIIQVEKVADKGGKENVLKLYNEMDWNVFKKNKVLFFVDRDLSEIVKENIPTDVNVYITDGYSIENSITSEHTCRRLLREIFMRDAEKSEINNILTKFTQAEQSFCKHMSLTMANIIFWKKDCNGVKANYNNIKLKGLYEFADCKINQIIDDEEYQKLIYKHANVDYKYYNKEAVHKNHQEFIDKKHHYKYIRGKYIMWFFWMFCKTASKSRTMDEHEFRDHATTRAVIPDSLKSFIEFNTNCLVNH